MFLSFLKDMGSKAGKNSLVNINGFMPQQLQAMWYCYVEVDSTCSLFSQHKNTILSTGFQFHIQLQLFL